LYGKVPAISDDGVVVFESPAIAPYLTDKFPNRRLGPPVGNPQRGAYLSWRVYYTGVLEPAFMCKFMKVEAPRATAGWVPLALDTTLAGQRHGATMAYIGCVTAPRAAATRAEQREG
jgi:glutathione S-transferase